ncbi:Transcriptional regulator [Didymosphaeria variabile]|uniref:Transcriptional regulator n=1 Tax=Didymosphaeria variabile TaxID=1932322 RepID=A0A9W9CF19_9PLEO|nr:Transcriptional regulator [Didymosphaeria variabile]KAJ4358328.1 Transcriptional regulator [Didymosphaeria variabile]
MSKNTSSKGKAKPGSKPLGTPRSRNTTPLPNVRNSVEPSSSNSYFRANISALSKKCDVTIEDILDRPGGNSQSTQPVPSSALLISMREAIESKVLGNIQKRCDVSNSALRELQGLKKNRSSHERDKERATDKDAEERKHKLKKIKKAAAEDERPLAVGAHGVARQDGVDLHKADNSSTLSSPTSQAAPSAAGAGAADAPSPTDTDASHQPPPAPAIPQFQTFGPDPSKFDDPTIYHIRDVTPGMSVEERREIFSVADYPESDLRDQTAGIPPDKDFSNAKPATQVNASVFANYVEPYIRRLTEEDMAFLKERGDRLSPFVLPRRGARHYKDIWAEEDGQLYADNNDRLPPNEARGSYENMTDDFLTTEDISTGPLLSRLLATLRPEGRGTSGNANDTNGVNGDAMDIDEGAGATTENNDNSVPAATQLSELVQQGWKGPPVGTRTDYASLNERLLLELKHNGIITDADTDMTAFDYDSHFDDEIAARLRVLQDELRKQSIINGARKQRLLELTGIRVAQQEYNDIADDLDGQLNQAYLKRNRNIGKGKKQTKRPGGAGGGSHPVPNAGVTRPGVGEPIRTLMERRGQWSATVGPVVNYGKTGLPEDTIFPEDKMKELENKEVEIWDNEADE